MSVTINIDNLRVQCGVVNINQSTTEKVLLTVNTREINIFDITQDDIKYLNSLMDSENEVGDIISPKYTKTFAFNLTTYTILEKIKVEGMARSKKMNLYVEGSSRPKYRDTTPPEGLIGTLVVILPTTYTGGEFVFSDITVEESLPKDRLQFIYFDQELEHSINKILSGNKIVLVYDVFDDELELESLDPVVELSPIPQEYYDQLLREAEEFCKDKNNVLFGACSYRNDLFYKLKSDLSEKFKLIKVAVELNDNEDKDIAEIQEVYEIDESRFLDEEDAFQMWKVNQSHEFKEFITNTYKVDQVLFPSLSVLQPGFISRTHRHGGWRGNSPIETWYTIEYIEGYLINPLESYKKNVKTKKNVNTKTSTKKAKRGRRT